MNKTSLIQIASVLPIAAASLATAQPIQYTIQALPCLESDPPNWGSNATGMNELGHVAGVAADDSGTSHAVVWIDGQIAADLRDVTPAAPGTYFPWGKGINIHGQVVGQGIEPYTPGGSIGVPMTASVAGGMWNPIPTPGTQSGWAWAINDSGQIGYGVGSGASIYDPIDGIRELTMPGGSRCEEVWEINNAGVATGSGSEGWLHAFRYDYDTDTIVDLGADPIFSTHSEGYGINELGDIAGWGKVEGS